ncbi:hypothetical protein ACEWY4_025089 [Coilia grayii]|uniref:Protein FAM111A n=1 Tax=Coilia grayii TaxID=363190 RepID=A0ABD1IYL7_9TELE
MTSPDANIIIQLGREDKDIIVPSHFPCCCIGDSESLTISCKSEMIEKTQNQKHRILYPKEKYIVFYVDTVRGLNAKTKEIFQSNAVKQYKRLCVYGENGMTTVAEVLRRDGRFSSYLGDFTLSDNENRDSLTLCTQKVNDSLHQKTFKIQLDKRQSDGHLLENPSNGAQRKCGERSAAEIAQQRGTSVKTAMEKTDSQSDTEIYELLCQQFPDLRKWMESRFEGDSYQKELELRQQNFGKIQQSYNEVHRIRKMLKLGESVCKITVGDFSEGTGFVLFDRFILSNAHLFKEHVDEQKALEDGIEVCALFNYEDPQPKTKFCYFTAKKRFVDIDHKLDYAILELNPEGLKSNQQAAKFNVPGLLGKVGPLPENGEACIIGHPAGGVKKMDPTFVIEKKNRKQPIDSHLAPLKDNIFMVLSIQQTLKNQGIDNIMIGNKAENDVITYNTFMYHGASGSPVFDGLGRVVGLHTAGYTYGFQNHKKHVIEYAIPLLAIVESFVGNLKENRNNELLKRVREVAKANQWLKPLLGAEPADVEEAMDLD